MKKIKYLGHIIEGKGRIPDPARSSAIKEVPVLKKVKILQAFLGLAKSYILIKNMPNLWTQLNNLLKKMLNGIGVMRARYLLKRQKKF